jgi:hypothetical protein
MLFGMFLSFLLIAVAEGGLLWLIWCRLGQHLRENPEAVAALTNHLIVPLMGRKEAPKEDPPAEMPGSPGP